MPNSDISRRSFLGTTAVSALALATAKPTYASFQPVGVAEAEEFKFEINRTDAEWREMLTDHEYYVMIEGGTEEKFTGDYWDHREEGTYACKGCGLTVFDSYWQEYPDVGWTFFRQSRPASILLGIDQPYAEGVDTRILSTIRADCIRCGAHLGRLITVNGTTLHCINGTSLVFEPAQV
ncbi:MAG: peptide-methionine (R)-S-oxide reductase [Pseudomonadota bacterium]